MKTTPETRAALDRILAAAKAEVAAGHIPHAMTAAGWLIYAVLRDDAADAAKDELDEETVEWSVASQVEAEADCHNDDRPRWDDAATTTMLAAEVGEAVDPDYSKPIDSATHTSWL